MELKELFNDFFQSEITEFKEKLQLARETITKFKSEIAKIQVPMLKNFSLADEETNKLSALSAWSNSSFTLAKISLC
jgi:hypothetical protein